LSENKNTDKKPHGNTRFNDDYHLKAREMARLYRELKKKEKEQ